jgi:hypothetical protein
MAASRRAPRIIVDRAPAGHVYPCTVAELKSQLRRIPPAYLEGLRQIRLSNQIRRYRDRDADYLDGEIRLFPYPEHLVFAASRQPHSAPDQEWLAWGAVWSDDAGGPTLRWTRAALRRYILDHVLLHELGHHYAAHHGLPDNEQAAERRARELRQQLAPAVL